MITRHTILDRVTNLNVIIISNIDNDYLTVDKIINAFHKH